MHDGASAEEKESVRPGSIVSNLEQRLDDIDVFGGEGDGEPPHREHHRKHRAHPDGDGQGGHDGGAGSSSFHAISGGGAEQQYLQLLQQMQYRELTPNDLQLLRQLEEQRSIANNHPSMSSGMGGSGGAGSSSGGGFGDPSPPGCSVRGSCGGGGNMSSPAVPAAIRPSDAGRHRGGGGGGSSGTGGSSAGAGGSNSGSEAGWSEAGRERSRQSD